jgi:hypothetical protein
VCVSGRDENEINFTYFRDDKFSFNYDHKFQEICKVSRLSINRNKNKPELSERAMWTRGGGVSCVMAKQNADNRQFGE